MTPTMLFVSLPGLRPTEARLMAEMATRTAVRLAPKLSGASSARFRPVFGPGFYGITWNDPHVWFQNAGIRPFTNRALAGKTIPMWIDDPTGAERAKNPQAKTRITESGKTQVLIFRRAAPLGARKRVIRNGVARDVPASYPGAPGRIAMREARQPNTTPGRVAGRIAQANVGVRWRHPGLEPRSFLNQGIMAAAQGAGVVVTPSMIKAT